MALDRAIDSAAHKAELKSIADSIRAKGGTTAPFPSAAAMKAAVDAIQTGGPAPVIQALTVTENGTYTPPSGVDGYNPVNVNVAGSGGGSEQLDALIDRSITEIHSNATKVGYGAFRGCERLSTAELPAATSIADYAFFQCENMTTANFPVATSVGASSLRECYALTSVYLPKAKTLGAYAFNRSGKIVSLELPLTATIGEHCFEKCYDLANISLPKVESIETFAFKDTNITELELPSVKKVADQSFIWMDPLTTLRMPGPTVCQATGDPRLPSGCQIYVPASLIGQYRAATNWSRYADQFVAIEGV